MLPPASMAASLFLRDPSVVADRGESRAVAHAVDDLRGRVEALIGRRPPLLDAWAEVAATAPSAIVVGRASFNAAAPALGLSPVDDDSPGPGGIALHARAGGQPVVLAAGSDPAGTNQAAIEALKALDMVDGALAFTGPVDRRERPTFRRRGFYSHTAWIYKHPYALSGWKYDDWRRYVDLLAHLNVNLWMLWVPAGLMPLPFDEADRRVLTKFRDLVAYAREQRGMQVWVIECPNNYLDVPTLLPFEEREYWRFYVEFLKDPRVPTDRANILASREAFYRIVDNADGYAMIDSDPGGLPGVPTEQMVDLFVENRRLLDRQAALGSRAKLIYWTHWSWGNGARRENWSAAFRGLRERLAEPWELFVCYAEHLAPAREQGLLDRATSMDYGAVEAEPSAPWTLVELDRLRGAVERALANPEIDGAMGNAQTPLVQLPHIATFLGYLWDAGRMNAPSAEALTELARLLYPEQAGLIARAWGQIETGRADELAATADEIDAVLESGRLGRPGAIGRLLFPSTDLVARDLALQLRVRERAERYRERWNAGADEGELEELLLGYFRHNLRWQLRHGYRKILGTYYERPAERYGAGRGTYGSYLEPLAGAWRRHVRNTGWTLDDLAAKRTRLKEALLASDEFPPAYVEGIVEDVLV